MFKEFKEFAIKGNALELAVGVIIGGAFQTIVKSLVDDIIMPFISIFIGNVDFSNWGFTIGHTTIAYGSFISAIINFLLIAFSLFLVVKYVNKFNSKLEEAKKEEMKRIAKFQKNNQFLGKVTKKMKIESEAEETVIPTTKICPYCFSEINIQATRCPHCTSNLKEEENTSC